MIALVKIGGSVLTDKHRALSFNADAARAIATDIHLSGTVPVIVHGTGSWGKALGRHYYTAGGWARDEAGFQLTCARIRALQEKLTAILRDEGVLCCPLQSNALFHRRRGTLDLYDPAPIAHLVDCGVAPLLSGDVLVEGPKIFKIVSSDEIMLGIARHLRVSDCVFATDVDGVLDPTGRLLQQVTQHNDLAPSSSDRDDVTGGMAAKITTAVRIAGTGARTIIVDGRASGRVRDALARRTVTGTLVAVDYKAPQLSAAA